VRVRFKKRKNPGWLNPGQEKTWELLKFPLFYCRYFIIYIFLCQHTATHTAIIPRPNIPGFFLPSKSILGGKTNEQTTGILK